MGQLKFAKIGSIIDDAEGHEDLSSLLFIINIKFCCDRQTWSKNQEDFDRNVYLYKV